LPYFNAIITKIIAIILVINSVVSLYCAILCGIRINFVEIVATAFGKQYLKIVMVNFNNNWLLGNREIFKIISIPPNGIAWNQQCLKFHTIQYILGYPNTSVPSSWEKCSDKRVCSDKWSLLVYVELRWTTLIEHTPVTKYSNKTYTSKRNTLIEQSSILFR